MLAAAPRIAACVAAAACALLVAVLAPAAAAGGRWLRPVDGEVARAFSYTRADPFAAGAHRGVDLAAAPGAAVRAACAGRVVHAGAVAGREQVVSLSCGERRVSFLPLAVVAVRAGDRVSAGAPIGTVAPGHGGLHVGVRRERDRFGYEDPLEQLAGSRRPSVPAPPPPVPRSAPPAAPRAPAPRARPAWRSPASVTEPVIGASAPAPWPVWAGLALLACGVAGSGTIAIRRRRHLRLHAARVASR